MHFHGFDTGDFASIGASIAATGLLVWAFLKPSNEGTAYFAIILAAVLSFMFARLNQRNTKNTEKRKLEVTEALSPIHGELLNIKSQFENNKKFESFYLPRPNVWSEQIVPTYKFYLLNVNGREKLGKYYADLSKLLDENLLAKIQEIGEEVATRISRKIIRDQWEVVWPSFVFLWNGKALTYGRENAIPMIGFWRRSLSKNEQLKLDFVALNRKDSGTELRLSGEQAATFEKQFFEMLFEDLDEDEDPDVPSLKKEYFRLQEETDRMLQLVRHAIEQWAD